MEKENYQKIKLLKLYELLKRETDDQNSMTTTEICNRLREMHISCDRRTLSRDISLLNEFGYEIMSEMRGHDKAYYVVERSFSVPELKLLMDAVHASSFITEKKANELIDKIANLGGNHRGELLKRNQPCFNVNRHSNEAIYYTIDACEQAIQDKKRLAFYYFDLDEHLNKVYRKNKKLYNVDPMALIFHNNNYYLLCFTSKYDRPTAYRLDRMDQTYILDEPVEEKAIIHASDVTHFTTQAFQMYVGDVEDITLQFPQHLIGVIFDKFGESTRITNQNNGSYTAKVQIQESPTFWGWLFTFENEMKILEPDSMKIKYQEQILKIQFDLF